MRISEIKDLNIAIVGGGYGGAAAAIALRHIGAENVHVYEQAPALGQVGAGIGLRPITVEHFRKWGIFEEIAAVSSPSDYLEILSADGKQVLVQEVWPQLNDFAQPNHTRIIHRGDFIDALLGVLPQEMVHLDHKLTSIEDQGAAATLTFENGNTVTADLVIGADGIRSLVRKQLFSDQEPVFAGEHAYRAVISLEDAFGLGADDDNPRFYMGQNGTIAYNLPLRHRGEVSYDITAPSEDGSWAPEITNDYLVSLLDGFDERIVKIAANLDISTVTSRSVFDIDPVENWHTDSVALLGDAAHAMLHHQGQGANSAILDAGGLADALLAADSVKEALALYQATRKPVTDELQRLSRLGWNANEVENAFPEAAQAK
ncbi:FAD-dependent oxidoreductase [Arthrobacter koreensis]|uniref:FAD-dependent oxidoreductase n=1 Tax=Arthrobacter koreensis TaxID=199136 RepID=UPI002DBC48E9|nr:FAD-dependent monooxygenase [Arthrobacter koreensis]MEB7447192.1 FAD-dependent monooxygenase [Arthrobacter koreensis]